MYFCTDTDLLPWEPGIFLDPGFAHQAILKDAPATLTGTALVTTDAVLSNLVPGMVAAVTLADGSLTQLLEIVALADATHATVSALRGRDAEPAIPAFAGGAVKVTVLSYRPQIAAVGDALLALVGITCDRAHEPAPAHGSLAGFRSAAAFATLAAIYRKLSDGTSPTSTAYAKKVFYEALALAARRALAATLDTDHDGTPDTRRHAALPVLERT